MLHAYVFKLICMQNIILTTPEQLEDIITKCLSRSTPARDPDTELKSAAGEEFLTSIRALATFLGCSVVSAQKLKNSGRIRYRQFGRKVIFSKAEILEDLRNTCKGRKKVLR